MSEDSGKAAADGEKPAAQGDSIAELRAKSAKYGTAYAIVSEGLTGKGVDRAVMVTKVLIGVIAAYALGSAVWAGVGG